MVDEEGHVIDASLASEPDEVGEWEDEAGSRKTELGESCSSSSSSLRLAAGDEVVVEAEAEAEAEGMMAAAAAGGQAHNGTIACRSSPLFTEAEGVMAAAAAAAGGEAHDGTIACRPSPLFTEASTLQATEQNLKPSCKLLSQVSHTFPTPFDGRGRGCGLWFKNTTLALLITYACTCAQSTSFWISYNLITSW